jgi:hypothetical protein
MPILQNNGTKDKSDKKLLSEIYEKYKARFRNLKVIQLEADSLYKVCVDIGLLFGIKMRKIRNAYETAIKGINGRAFDCQAMLVILN